MPPTLRPMTLAPPNEPCVGIVWRVADALVIDRSILREAEPFGDCLTHPVGHDELWEAWRRLGATHLARRGLPSAIASSEYDVYARASSFRPPRVAATSRRPPRSLGKSPQR